MSLHPPLPIIDFPHSPSRSSLWKKWVRRSKETEPISSCSFCSWQMLSPFFTWLECCCWAPPARIAGWTCCSSRLGWMSAGTHPCAHAAVLPFVPTVDIFMEPVLVCSKWTGIIVLVLWLGFSLYFLITTYVLFIYSLILRPYTLHNLTTLKSGCALPSHLKITDGSFLFIMVPFKTDDLVESIKYICRVNSFFYLLAFDWRICVFPQIGNFTNKSQHIWVVLDANKLAFTLVKWPLHIAHTLLYSYWYSLIIFGWALEQCWQ